MEIDAVVEDGVPELELDLTAVEEPIEPRCHETGDAAAPGEPTDLQDVEPAALPEMKPLPDLSDQLGSDEDDK